ncbi:hypothetical protein [Pseudomonas phage vB_Pae_CF165a]|nr:hypothetical protein [Pseudomonas phage vB_Pae_CF165a]
MPGSELAPAPLNAASAICRMFAAGRSSCSGQGNSAMVRSARRARSSGISPVPSVPARCFATVSRMTRSAFMAWSELPSWPSLATRSIRLSACFMASPGRARARRHLWLCQNRLGYGFIGASGACRTCTPFGDPVLVITEQSVQVDVVHLLPGIRRPRPDTAIERVFDIVGLDSVGIAPCTQFAPGLRVELSLGEVLYCLDRRLPGTTPEFICKTTCLADGG